jgi:hypothetical protein
MSQQVNSNGHARRLEQFVVVRVEDTIEPALTEQMGGRYESPPQTREQAMALVRLLLGRFVHEDGGHQWTAPIAGGRRVVTVTVEMKP